MNINKKKLKTSKIYQQLINESLIYYNYYNLYTASIVVVKTIQIDNIGTFCLYLSRTRPNVQNVHLKLTNKEK